MRLTVRIRDPRWEKRHAYMDGVVREFNDYTGDLVPRMPWLDDNWFVLTTGDKDAPLRILHKDNILGGWTAPPVVGKEAGPTYVCIPGKSGKQYTVALADDGSLSCNCTGYGYRRTCSHVREVMEAA